MNKGEQTKDRILHCAMHYVCQHGLTSISIGEIAKRLAMSRTGVISHFADKEDMQIAILRYCESVFIKQVLKPSFSADPVTHLRQHAHNWINWVFRLTQQKQMTCPFVKAVAEFQDKPDCPVKQVITEQQQRTIGYLTELVQRNIEQNVQAEGDTASRVANDIYCFYLGHNISKHLLNDPQADARFHHQIEQLIQSI